MVPPDFEALEKTFSFERHARNPDSTILPGTVVALASTVASPTVPKLKTPTDGTLELLSVLGRGGMGVVWTARQASLERMVAVKRLGQPPFDERDTSSLLAEARTTGALEHPSIVPVHELRLDDDGSPLLVMKRVEGVTLGTLVAETTHPTWKSLEQRHGDRHAAITDVLMRVCDALEFAHQRGVIHRDVKCDNIMIGAFGEVYLLDWGIALHVGNASEKLELVGTPASMAPEMVRGDARHIDARSDVYLLGATLHHALTGRPRHEGPSMHAVLLAAFKSDPPVLPAEVPEELAALIRRATAADPTQRPQSASAFREELAGFSRHRASNRLADAALTQLSQLEQSTETLASLEASRALTETRFALTQSLREWPENHRAMAGLERALALSVRAELARGSAGTAATLLRELKTPTPELTAEVRAAEARTVERSQLAARAEREALESDASLSSAVRQRMAAVFAGTLALFIVGALSGFAPNGIGYGLAFTSDLGFLVVSLAILYVTRERALVNRWSRHAVGLFLVAALGTTLSHGVGWLRGDDVALRGDSPTQVMLAVIFGVGAMLLSRRLLVPALVGAAGAIISAIWPGVSLLASAVIALTAVVTLATTSPARRPE